MRGRTILIAALTAAALCWGSARAEPPDKLMPGSRLGGRRFMMGPPDGHGMMGEGGGFMLPLVLHRANLTSEQHDKVRKILESDRQDLQKLSSELGKANDELSRKLFAPGDVALADLKTQLDEVAGLRRQLMEQGVKTALAIRKVLTPEQLAKVAEVKQRMDKLRAEMRELMEGDDPPPPPPL